MVIIGLTDPIPNDTVSFRKDFPGGLRDRIVDALLAYSRSKEGKQVLMDLYDISGLIRSDDSRYQIVRDTIQALHKKPDDFLPQ